MRRVIVTLLVLSAVFFKIAGEDVPQPKYTDNENQNAMDFAQALIQRDYTCERVTMYSTDNDSDRIDVRCYGKYKYEIIQPGGRWMVVSK